MSRQPKRLHDPGEGAGFAMEVVFAPPIGPALEQLIPADSCLRNPVVWGIMVEGLSKVECHSSVGSVKFEKMLRRHEKEGWGQSSEIAQHAVFGRMRIIVLSPWRLIGTGHNSYVTKHNHRR